MASSNSSNKDIVTKILGQKAFKIKNLINKYIALNPDIKEYKHQQYTIKNSRYFEVIDTVEKAYFFGLLMADGSLSHDGHYSISLELSSKDRDRISFFASEVGFSLDRIGSRVRDYYYKGEKKSSKFSLVKFGCKPMFNDLIEQGFSSSKAERHDLPNFIYDLVEKAKNEVKSTRQTKITDWMYTPSGGIAIAFLLGYFDGDGSVSGCSTGRVYSASKAFLQAIRGLFAIKNMVLTQVEPFAEVLVFNHLTESKGMYSLTLGRDVYDAMMNSFRNSMQRKRINSNVKVDDNNYIN